MIRIVAITLVISFLMAFGLVQFVYPAIASDQPPPVEVHIQEGDNIYMYDCWPVSFDEDMPEEYMIVYLNYQEGVAGYLCNYAAGAHKIPGLPQWPVIRVSLGPYELLFFLVLS